MDKKGLNLGLALIVIGGIILIFGFVLFFSPRMKEEVKLSPLPELSISDLKLCNSIDDNFVCDENVDGIFNRGDSVFVYFVVDNLNVKEVNGNYMIGVVEDRDVFDPDNKLITELKRKNVIDTEKEVAINGIYSMPIKNELITSSSEKLGKYKISISIKDKFSNQKDEKTINFELR